MIQWFLGVAALAAIIYYFCIKPISYWRERGVKQNDRPTWLLGDDWKFIIRKESFFEFTVRCYNQFQGTRYYGIYESGQPTLLIKDPEILRKITVKDFDHFTNHRNFIPEEADPLFGKNLFFSKGEKWREMRPILSPAFTSSKMRTTFVLISKCTKEFVNHFLKKNQKCIEMEMKDTFTRFTNDVIATSAFGVEVDSLKEPDNEFYLMGKEATDLGGFGIMFKFIAYSLVPELMKFLRITLLKQAVIKFFCDLVDNTMQVREKNNIIRPDMIHLLMEAKKGVHHKEENSDVNTGFTTVKEADLESLRKWPSTVSTDRVCTKPYTIEAMNADEKPLHIEKGISLMIPIVGIHRDPKYYPDPERFDPERFNDENKGKIDPFTYMPFGLGPRNCIGSRFALLETKLLFFHLLSHFELVPVEKTQVPLKLSRKTFNLTAEKGFWLGLKRLEK
ncbi:cytochrome P450 9e2-like isoform X2 [Leptinotarsa decemlineata]|uniref:cytochrome P450 9e2-like isoform X2 n=1 Tax=Leptinotarsa decemlineata TaxID=7539 RepID=UPI003D307DBA